MLGPQATQAVPFIPVTIEVAYLRSGFPTRQAAQVRQVFSCSRCSPQWLSRGRLPPARDCTTLGPECRGDVQSVQACSTVCVVEHFADLFAFLDRLFNGRQLKQTRSVSCPRQSSAPCGTLGGPSSNGYHTPTDGNDLTQIRPSSRPSGTKGSRCNFSDSLLV